MQLTFVGCYFFWNDAVTIIANDVTFGNDAACVVAALILGMLLAIPVAAVFVFFIFNNYET